MMERRPWSLSLSVLVFGSALVAGVGCQRTASSSAQSARATEVSVLAVPSSSGAATDLETPPPSAEDEATSAESSNEEPPQGDTCGLQAKLRSKGADGLYALTLTNTGRRPVRLVVPGDGSEVGWRTPILSFKVSSPAGEAVEELPFGRCGMMNAMEASEVFTLAPGASRELTDWIGRPAVKPGTYDVKLRYRNDPKRVRSASPDVAKLVAGTDACDVTSNAIRVTVTQ